MVAWWQQKEFQFVLWVIDSQERLGWRVGPTDGETDIGSVVLGGSKEWPMEPFRKAPAAHWLPVLMVETSYNSCVVVLAGL